jgi:cellulose synthase/poly-beta-1,6-N-acetylglucosamine synthase-like glycosyltransferase
MMTALWGIWVFVNLAYLFLDFLLLKGLRRWMPPKGAFNPDKQPGHPTFPSVTVLIAARNEETVLPALLKDLAAQEYPGPTPQFLIVDDRSTDSTPRLLEAASQSDSRFEWIRIDQCPPGISPKKHALGQALSQAKGDWILTTDADCRMGPFWVKSFLLGLKPKVGMRVGLSCYEASIPKRWGQGIQDMEFVSYGIVGAGLLGLGFPVHANANNLAYSKAAYLETGGMKAHGHIVSGDDDFLLQAIHASNRWSIEFSSNPDSYVQTRPPATWSEFWQQRKRWASKCGFYAPKQLLFLSLIFAYYSAILGFGLTAWISKPVLWAFAIGFIFKTVGDGLVMAAGNHWLKIPMKAWAFFPTALLHIPLILAATVWGSLRGFTWKDGRVLPSMKPRMKTATRG